MIWITAATPWEASPLARRWRLRPAPSDSFEGSVSGRPLRLLRTGMGAERTAEALRSAAETGPSPSAVVSVGFAGALQEGLRPADLVADMRGVPLEWVEAARAAATGADVRLSLGIFHSAERVLRPAEKRAIGLERRALAVEMETAPVRRWCEARGIPGMGVRAVFDAVEETAPDEGPQDDSPASIARFLLIHWRDVPRLAAWWPRQARGLSRLARFLERWLPSVG